MNQTQALEVVRALANGVDPDTGEVFSAESPYHRPPTVRALFVAGPALERVTDPAVRVVCVDRTLSTGLARPDLYN